MLFASFLYYITIFIKNAFISMPLEGFFKNNCLENLKVSLKCFKGSLKTHIGGEYF